MSQATLFDEPKPAPPTALCRFIAGQLGFAAAGERKLTALDKAQLEQIAADAIRRAQEVTG